MNAPEKPEETLFNAARQLVGTAATVHVTMDKATKTKVPLPADLRAKIQDLYMRDNIS